MTNSRKDLPDFDNPPLDEVALSVQFNPIAGLQAPQQGLLWSEFRDAFPRTEQHPPIDPVIETFGLPQKRAMRFELVSGVPSPRCWFLNKEGTELIQVQQDRFTHNWRKVGETDTYPRYEHVRDQFASELSIFHGFLGKEELGEFVPVQCAVTYINHIVACEAWGAHGELGNVFTNWVNAYSDDFLGEPEQVRFASQFVFSDDHDQPLGRLHVSVQSAFRAQDNLPIFVMEMTARGRPDGDGTDGILQFLNKGREMIVRSFASLTTPEMHKIWGRKK